MPSLTVVPQTPMLCKCVYVYIRLYVLQATSFSRGTQMKNHVVLKSLIYRRYVMSVFQKVWRRRRRRRSPIGPWDERHRQSS